MMTSAAEDDAETVFETLDTNCTLTQLSTQEDLIAIKITFCLVNFGHYNLCEKHWSSGLPTTNTMLSSN
jgi:hypothetical protein